MGTMFAIGCRFPRPKLCFPTTRNLSLWPLTPPRPGGEHLWKLRTSLENIVLFEGKTRQDLGEKWWTWYRWIPERYRTPRSIAFAFVATHNHFVLDHGGKVFKQSA